ncbi:MAG: transaldolase [Clostridia bacterium]|nr:transaldolase [Clostridia bacterium]
MKLFIDTANLDEIKKANELGIICGVTTNPTLIAREGRDFKTTIREIIGIIPNVPINAEVLSETADKMVPEAIELSEISPNMVIKIPICKEGLKATSILSKKGIKVNNTLIFSAAQALLAVNAGASYVSSFLGRVDDIGMDGISLLNEITEIFNIQGISAQIIAASIRSPLHVTQAALSGCDIATIPYKILMQMIDHPLTSKGIEIFNNAGKA